MTLDNVKTFCSMNAFDAGIVTRKNCEFSHGLGPLVPKGLQYQRAFCRIGGRTNGCGTIRKGPPCHSGRYQCGSGLPDNQQDGQTRPMVNQSGKQDRCPVKKYCPSRDSSQDLSGWNVVSDWRCCPRRAKGFSLVGGVPNAALKNGIHRVPYSVCFSRSDPDSGVTVSSADPEPTSVHSRSSFAAKPVQGTGTRL